jgi:hypothetical protein
MGTRLVWRLRRDPCLIGIASGDLCDAERPPLDTGQESI